MYLWFVAVIAVPAVFWLALLFTLFRVVWDTRTASVSRAASSAGGIALQLVLAVLLTLVVTYGLNRDLLGAWLSITALLPVGLPLFGLFAWSKFYGFLAWPLLCATLVSATAVAVWTSRLTGRPRLLWPTVLVVSFFATFVAVGEFRFHRDVRSAAERLSPDCLDAGSLLDALASGVGHGRFSLHAAARKGSETFGWSFRKRDFYKVPETVDRNVRSARSRWFVSRYPSCRA